LVLLGVSEGLRLFVARRRGRRFMFLADLEVTYNTGGSHSSDIHWLRIHRMNAGHVLAEVRTDAWFSYPHLPTHSWSRERKIAVCSTGDGALACTALTRVAGQNRVGVSGHPWDALEEDWWTHRLRPGEGDSTTEARLSFDDPGLVRVRVTRTPALDDVEPKEVLYLQYGDLPPLPSPLAGRDVAAGADPREGLSDRGSLEQLCGQLGSEETTCALQPIGRSLALLVARADDRRVVFLVGVRPEGLVLRARVVDRYAAHEPLVPVDLRETRPLPGGRVGYVVDVREAGDLLRYLLVCERRSERCVARVPLRRIEWVDALRSEGRLDPVRASEAEVEIRDDVLSMRLIAGDWGALFRDEEAEMPGADERFEMELPRLEGR